MEGVWIYNKNILKKEPILQGRKTGYEKNIYKYTFGSYGGDSGTDNETDQVEDTIMKITVGDTTFTAELVDNSSAEALQELLVEGPLTIDMSDYGNMEKVGPIGTNLPRNDEQTTTGAGDIILYQGNYYL